MRRLIFWLFKDRMKKASEEFISWQFALPYIRLHDINDQKKQLFEIIKRNF